MIELRKGDLWTPYHKDWLTWLLYEQFNPLVEQTFELGGEKIPYFVHPYNHTWDNERAVEIPTAINFLDFTCRVLEIGNVLPHYIDWEHTVIDRDEACSFRPVVNVDFMEFDPPELFDQIVSISTIEHMGWDYWPRDVEKPFLALEKIQALLKPEGEALVTIPVGYNSFVDWILGDLNVKTRCLQRLTKENQWIEIALEDALRCEYGCPFRSANAVVFISLTGGSDVSLY